ncbi:MAG: hypothetical protein WAV16_01950 [Candidatus Moraniibacteriota bacterium]
MLLSTAFNSLSWFTTIAFKGKEEGIAQTFSYIGLFLAVAALIFFFKVLRMTFVDGGKKAVLGTVIMTAGGAFLVSGAWNITGSLFALWGLDNPKGFTAMVSVALALLTIALVLGCLGYYIATSVEGKPKSTGRAIGQAH